ncbi:MAG: hypothetical protein GX328_06790 [Clostridiaceae bacterium]|nr:hypothetical protein [Clostridiaceae bacterium]
MITIFFYIALFAVAVFTYYQMKREVRAEKLLLQEIIELEQKLQYFDSQRYLLKQNQTRQSDSKKNKSNKARIINYQKHVRSSSNQKIKSKIKSQIIPAQSNTIPNQSLAFYLEDIDKIA